MGGDKGGKGKGKGPEGGTVKHFVAEKGFGFIKPDDGGPDIFVLAANCGGKGASLVTGGQVWFTREFNERSGKEMATNVSGPGAPDADGGKGGGDWGKGDKGGDWGKGDKGGKDMKGKDKGGKDGKEGKDGKGKGKDAMGPPGPAPSSDWAATTAPDGKTYYYNKVTKETSWDPPPGFGGAGGGGPPADKGGKGGDFDKGGKGKDGKGKDGKGWDDGKGKDKGGWDDGKGKGKEGKDKGGWDDGKGKGGWDDGKGNQKGGWDDGKGKGGDKGKKDSAPPPLGPQSAPAPAASGGDWKEAQCPETGKPYWYHRTTKQVTWDRPADFVPSQAGGKGKGAPASAPAATISEWKEAKDKEGKTYYYNKRTKATQWDPPPGYTAPY